MKYLKKAWLVLVIAMISMTFLGNTAVIIDNQPEYVEVEESIESEYVSEQAITDELLGNLSILENYLETNGTNMMIEAQKQIDLYTYIANEAEIEEESNVPAKTGIRRNILACKCV